MHHFLVPILSCIAASVIATTANAACGSFTDIGASLTAVSLSSVAWGDYDNDGDFDILLTGQTSTGAVAKVYRNDGGAFTDIAAPLLGVYFSSVAWADYDNDGDLDVLLTGFDGSLMVTKLYRNAGGAFSDIGSSLTALGGCSAWGDYDKDGDLDILITGLTPTVDVSKVYRNDGSGTFTDIGAALAGVENCSVAWGDYDNDGDLDILITGLNDTAPVSKVYRNVGGVFTDIGASLIPVENCSAAWGDYDNDGDLDILLTGLSAAGAVSKIYRNDGGTFTNIGASLIAVENPSVAWGDYDNDGDLDILLTGMSAGGRVAKAYRNEACFPNTPPAAPVGLICSVINGGAIFNWNASTDTQTPAPGLHYNLRVGTTPGGNQISSVMASSSGFRRVARQGNAQQSGWKLHLPAGNYYWSVQAIDAAFAGSPFAAEKTFTVATVDVLNAVDLPVVFALIASRPNPFSRSAVIGFDLPRTARVGLRIYDLGGRVVRTLADESWPAGRHQLEWDGTDRDGRPARAGVYFCAMLADDFLSQHRMVRVN